jgi:hypothetical protein
MLVLHRISNFSVGFYFDSTLILETLAIKLCMAIVARPYVYGSLLMFVLTPTHGLCCVWFIYPVLGWFWCLEIVTSSNGWAELSRLLPEDRESDIQNFFKIKILDDNVQKLNNCINVSFSQTFRS